MRVLVSGSSGLVGRALVDFLARDGGDVIRLVRRSARGPDELSWRPGAAGIASDALPSVDAVVHLAGENIGGRLRWNDAHKKRVLESRVSGTRALAHALAHAAHRPNVMVVASATGFYGDRGDTEVDEDSTGGQGFLARVCREWEAATAEAEAAGIRVVHVRIGIVLARDGGALARMVPLFRYGLGGRLGSGEQWMSWIGLPDLVRIITFLIQEQTFNGPVNAVTPNSVRNRDFTKILGDQLGRPALFPVPAFALRLALGEMADEMLLGSIRVRPGRLQEAGFTFKMPFLEEAIREALSS